MYDTHCHILPGIDDGAHDMEESMVMCAMAVDDGIRGIVATPHHANGVYMNPREEVVSVVQAVRDELDMRGIPLQIFPGSEVHLHNNLMDEIRAGTLCTYGDHGKALLIEAPPQILPDRIKDEIFALKLAGITPILAHAERNKAVQDDPDKVLELVRMGCLVQVTAMSVLGDFGDMPERTARQLLKARSAHLVATDAHSPRSRPPKLAAAMNVIDGIFRDDPEFAALVHRLPRAVALGEPLPEIPSPLERSSKKTFWSFLHR